MDVGIIMSITNEEDRRVCEEIEPRVNYERLVGDGVYRGAYTGEELLKELVVNGRTKEMKSMDEFEVFEWGAVRGLDEAIRHQVDRQQEVRLTDGRVDREEQMCSQEV